ncbi:MAG: hypothetical protein H0X49_10175 [Acidobacteria bacterium]|nr:hypothetical protein [Acidobacteriota bacterium]
MFNLKFISNKNFSPERNEEVALGEISLGNFTENFESSLSFWRIEDYEKQWIEAAKRIIEFEQTAFITDLDNPKTSNFITWWKAWKIEEEIFVQNQLLFLNQFPDLFDIKNPYKFIGNRTTKTEDSEQISEWKISLEDIENFLKANE